MSAQGNTLVVHVISARDLYIRGHKPLDVYVSLSTTGKGPWKSKVTTNPLRVEPGEQQMETRWDEHCEFQLNDTDTKLVVHVNHKTLLGTTETLGELVLPLDAMARFQPAAWFRLGASGGKTDQHQQQQNQKPRGQIQMGYQFSNRLATSVSNMSLNKLEKEKKFDRLRRKMQQLGRSKKAMVQEGDDARSLASISITAGLASRRSSVSSCTNSAALAFSSPSPNAMMMDEHKIHSKEDDDTPSLHSTDNFHASARSHQQQQSLAAGPRARAWGASTTTAEIARQSTQSVQSGADESGHLSMRANPPPMDPAPDFDHLSLNSSVAANHTETTIPTPAPRSSNNGNNNLKVKMRQKAEQLLMLRGSWAKPQQPHPQVTIDDFGGGGGSHSRRGSIASSSGFVSLGSGHTGALNEHTSPEHLLSVITHLRRELHRKEDRIRDLEDYTDKLVMKVMVSNPELLQAADAPKITTKRAMRR